MQEAHYFTEALEHPIFKTISEISNNLGMESYVIGGYVRDHLLKRGNSKDIDIVTVDNNAGVSEFELHS